MSQPYHDKVKYVRGLVYYSISDFSRKKVEAEAEGDVDKPSEADNKAKAIDLKIQAIENLKKYLEMKPNAEDQQTVKELIADSSKFLEKEDSSKVGE